MAFEDVYLVSNKLILTPESELDELERWMEVPLPRGYRQYMSSLGSGTYCDLVRVLTPCQIREARNERREFIREYYRQFWRDNESILTFEDAAKGVLFANTDDGDEIYCCTDQGKMFALPRHDDAVYELGLGFEDPLNWTSPRRQSTVFQPPFRYFEPCGKDRRVIEFFTSRSQNVEALTDHFQRIWSGQEVRSIPGPGSVLLFPKAIRGRVQLTQAPGDVRVGIRIDYDVDCSGDLEQLASELRGLGFYETWRHPYVELGHAST